MISKHKSLKNKLLAIFLSIWLGLKGSFFVSSVLAAPGGTIWLISIVPSLSITFVVFSAQLSPFPTANEGTIRLPTAICVLLHSASESSSPPQQSKHHRPHHSLALSEPGNVLSESSVDDFSGSNLQLKQAYWCTHISGCSHSGSLSIPSRHVIFLNLPSYLNNNSLVIITANKKQTATATDHHLGNKASVKWSDCVSSRPIAAANAAKTVKATATLGTLNNSLSIMCTTYIEIRKISLCSSNSSSNTNLIKSHIDLCSENQTK